MKTAADLSVRLNTSRPFKNWRINKGVKKITEFN